MCAEGDMEVFGGCAEMQRLGVAHRSRATPWWGGGAVERGCVSGCGGSVAFFLGVGYWVLGVGCLVLGVGRLVLGVGCWLFGVGVSVMGWGGVIVML